MELVFHLEMVNEFVGVLVVDTMGRIEPYRVNFACNGSAEAEGTKGVVGLGDAEAEHAESSKSKEQRKEGGPRGGKKDGNSHEGTESEEDESDPGGDISREAGAKGKALG